MRTATTSEEPAIDTQRRQLDWEDLVWLALGLVLFAVTMAVGYRPSTDTPGDVVLAVMPWILVVGLVVGLGATSVGLGRGVRAVAILIVFVAWAFNIFGDDRWSMMTFVLYAVCFIFDTDRLWVGITLSGAVSTIWAVAWLSQDAPAWAAVIPYGVFVASSMIGFGMTTNERTNAAQADLIAELQATQQELAVAERAKGVLEERTRMAAEIHDTLAQGFTSIVLVSRAAQRAGEQSETLASIEQTAQQNLDAARRLVGEMQPSELETGSLRDAIDRHLTTAVPDAIATELRVVGEPRQLTGAVEVTLLRAAQEALLNVVTHAAADQVDVTLSYLDDSVALDVRDDGVGFVPGSVTDRGSLTGGQGLELLAKRAESLAGEVTIETNRGGGSVISVLLPVHTP